MDTVHEVLQADWHEDWHDSQFGRSFFQLGTITGIICSGFTRIPLSGSGNLHNALRSTVQIRLYGAMMYWQHPGVPMSASRCRERRRRPGVRLRYLCSSGIIRLHAQIDSCGGRCVQECVSFPSGPIIAQNARRTDLPKKGGSSASAAFVSEFSSAFDRLRLKDTSRALFRLPRV